MAEPVEPQGPRGPIEDFPWPEQLTAHVVEPGPRPRIQGYCVQTDLAVHHRFTDVLLASLCGELPDQATGRAFELALLFLCPISVAEAPAHAAVLSQLCVAHPSGVLQTGAIVLAEQARFFVEQHGPVLAWLEHPDEPFPPGFQAPSEEERASVRDLQGLLAEAGVHLDLFAHDPSLMSALLAVLVFCGLRAPGPLMTALFLSRFGLVAAEAFCHKPGDFRNYPMNVPSFHYVPGVRT